VLERENWRVFEFQCTASPHYRLAASKQASSKKQEQRVVSMEAKVGKLVERKKERKGLTNIRPLCVCIYVYMC